MKIEFAVVDPISRIDEDIMYKHFLTTLSDRHRKIMELVGMGYNQREIADSVGENVKTMNYQCKKIRKLWAEWNKKGE